MLRFRELHSCFLFSPLQAIRVFFMLRALSLQLQGEPETQLPLTRPEDLIKTDDVLDLSESLTLPGKLYSFLFFFNQ